MKIKSNQRAKVEIRVTTREANRALSEMVIKTKKVRNNLINHSSSNSVLNNRRINNSNPRVRASNKSRSLNKFKHKRSRTSLSV